MGLLSLHAMNSSRRLATLASSACAVALLCAATGVCAQEILKGVDEEGRATFSDQPTPPPKRKSAMLPRRGGKVDVSEAARRLECAQQARQEGLEPRPGELTLVKGTQTVNYRYWQRQEKLRVALEQAQRRSQDTVRISGRGPPKVSQI